MNLPVYLLPEIPLSPVPFKVCQFVSALVESDTLEYFVYPNLKKPSVLVKELGPEKS